MSAFAQSSVTLSGLVDSGYAIQKTYGDTTSAVIQNASKTSTFKFAGTEDLGSGLNANFQFEVQPSYIAGNGNTTTASTITTTAYTNGSAQGTGQASAQSGLVGKGQNWVGIGSSSAGGLRFGTINVVTLDAHANASQALGTNTGSGYKTIGSEFTRYENSFQYTSPSFNGLTALFQRGTGMDQAYGTTTTVTLRRAEMNELGLKYDQGPVALRAASLKTKSSPNEASASANITTRVTTLSAKYNVGPISVGAFSQNLSDDIATTPTKYKASMYSFEVPMGAYTFTALTGVQKSTGMGAATSATVVAGDNKITSFQAKYDLSKRTYIYVINESRTTGSANWSKVVVNGSALTAAATDPTVKTTALGIVHNF